MKLTSVIAPVALTLLTLAGCKKSDDQPKAAAGGELLPRSVSDDMLPYDTVRSQASLSAPDDGLTGTRTRAPISAASAATQDDVVSDPVEEEAPPVIDAPPPPATQP